MIRRAARVVCDRAAWIAVGVVVGAAPAATALLPTAPQTPPLPAPAQQAQTTPPPRVFSSDVGLVLNFIKPDKTKDFEAIVAKLKEALADSSDERRQAQAKSWRVFKATEPAAGGAALYVFIVDPPVKDADYAVTGVLGESLSSADLTAITKQYVDSYASGQNFVNLTLVSDLRK
jgi:hypothetical protein